MEIRVWVSQKRLQLRIQVKPWKKPSKTLATYKCFQRKLRHRDLLCFPFIESRLRRSWFLTNNFSIFVLKTAKSLFLNFLNPNWAQKAFLAGEKTLEYFIQPEKLSRGRCVIGSSSKDQGLICLQGISRSRISHGRSQKNKFIRFIFNLKLRVCNWFYFEISLTVMKDEVHGVRSMLRQLLQYQVPWLFTRHRTIFWPGKKNWADDNFVFTELFNTLALFTRNGSLTFVSGFTICLRRLLLYQIQNSVSQHRRPKLTLGVHVNELSHKRVGVALQGTVETLYEK